MTDRITTEAANENVLSSDGRTLYVIGTDGRVRAYDVETRALLNTWAVGTRLGGADVTPDGRYLVVAEREPILGPLDQNGQRSVTITVHRLDLQTGEVRSYDTTPGFGGGAFYDVAVLADGTALLTASYNGSGWVNLRALNLETGVFTNLSHSVRQDSVLSLSDDRTLVFVGEPNISNAEIDLYRAGTGGALTLIATNGNGSGFNRGIQDISGDGRYVVNVLGSNILIFDGQLRFVRNLANDAPSWHGGRVEGVAFDETGRFVYLLDADRKEIIQVSTETWSLVAAFQLDPSYAPAQFYDFLGRFGNNLTLTNDGQFFIVHTSTGIQRVSTADAILPIRGTAGDDRLIGTSDSDRIEGLAGADVIDSRGGADLMSGGAGADTFLFTTSSATMSTSAGQIDGGADVDTIDVRAIGDATISAGYNSVTYRDEFQLSVGGQRYAIRNVETIQFGDSVQNIQQLSNLPAPIAIRAGGGNDTLAVSTLISAFGEAGDDVFTLYSGGFSSTTRVGLIDGGSGIDRLNLNAYADTEIDLVAGTITIAPGTYNAASFTITGVEQIQVSAVYATMSVRGSDANETFLIEPRSSDSTGVAFDGRGGNDNLTGGSAADQLSGGAGNDTITGQAGDDRLDGGHGLDTAVFSGARGDARIVNLGGGQFGVSGADGVDILTGVERVQFSNATFALPTAMFAAPAQATQTFGAADAAGGWASADRYPRVMADVNGDGRDDIVGFGDAGVYVSLANATSGFGAITFATAQFGALESAGGWTSAGVHPRTAADVNGDGRADLVGFGIAGTYVALATSTGGFGEIQLATSAFGTSPGAGGWSSDDRYPRVLADVNGDGRADIVGFGIEGTYVALADGKGGFGDMRLATAAFGTGPNAGNWASDDRYPRTLADVNGDGRADIVGFGIEGVHVALANGDGSFGEMRLAARAFGTGPDAGNWTSDDRYPRMLADVNGDGRADIVGFGFDGVYLALADGNGGFGDMALVAREFGVNAGGWASDDRYPRLLADVNGDGLADIVGFGNGGMHVMLAADLIQIA